jgi:lysophospholipase L1-like esterase
MFPAAGEAAPNASDRASGAASVRLVVLPRRCATVLALAAVAAVLAAAPAAAQHGPPTGPSTVVVLGDSAASGEGAGDYEPGTRGENGDWCHRSTHAYVHRTAMADRSVNLACSGARSADVAVGGRHYGEGSQARRLGVLAARQRVTAVLLQVGGNDDPALIPTGVACIRAFLDPAVPGCRETVGPQWPARLAAMAPKVEAAVRDVRSALRGAGYADTDYALVLVSYASPVTEAMRGVPAVEGCPYSRADAAWGRTVAIPQLSAALRGVAARARVAFLALDRATEGREACSRARPTEEWQRRLTVDPRAWVYGGLDEGTAHLAQASFHPSAAGHAELGRCAGEFLRTAAAGAGQGSCRAGPDGHLHAVPLPAVPSRSAPADAA